MPTKAKPKPKSTNPNTSGLDGTKFQPIMLVSIYRYAKLGMPEAAIADALPATIKTWQKWKKKFPEILQAMQMGRTDTKDGGDWHKFVYDRLPEDLQSLWSQLEAWDELPNGMAKIKALLEDHGKSVRQQLFIYALVHTNFSHSKAMSKVCIDKDTLDYWIQNDPDFARLVEEIQWHKGNFYEEALVGLIKAGDTGATIFANRTFNKDRGYGVKNEIDVHHSGNIEHSLLDLTELDLTPDIQIAILEAIRRRDQKMAALKARPTITLLT
jgi:hypothetical protein